MADPWVDAAAKYPGGTAMTARVARVESFGAFLEAEEGLEGLLPVSEISWQRIKHPADRKSTRLNSSHSQISYAVFCLKKKKRTEIAPSDNHIAVSHCLLYLSD